MSRTIDPRRAERHAHADLAGAPLHGVAQHAVGAEHGEEQREPRGQRHQQHDESVVLHAVADHRLGGANLPHRLIGIDRPDRLLHAARQTSAARRWS